MMCGRIERLEVRTERATRCADACQSPTRTSASVGKGVPVDPRWSGIVEVLVHSLSGTVVWEPGSVVLRLPDRSRANRMDDLDALRLCLARMGVLVVFDASRAAQPDACLLFFLRKLVDSGLMVGIGRTAVI